MNKYYRVNITDHIIKLKYTNENESEPNLYLDKQGACQPYTISRLTYLPNYTSFNPPEEYRPFESALEFLPYSDRLITSKNHPSVFKKVLMFNDDHIKLTSGNSSSTFPVEYKYLFEHYQFYLDKDKQTPCGIIIE